MTFRRFALGCSFALALSAPSLAAEPPARVALPAARTQGTVSVEAALQARRSVRSFAAAPMTLAQLAQLCWAAQGITDPARGHRTTPSAHASYPLELHVLAGAVQDLPPGHYRYLPEAHALELVAAGDARADFVKQSVGQSWVAKAPAIVVVTGRIAKMGAMGEGAGPFMMAEAGAAAQGLFLQAEAMGLGSTYVGGFKPKEASKVLGLAEGEAVLAVLPVGRKP